MAKAASKKATKKGLTIKISSASRVQLIESYLSRKYDFRHNPVSERTEFKTKKAKEYQLLSERDLNSIFRDLNNHDISCQLSTLKSILNSDFIPTRDPFLEYFESLPKYKKGDPDYIRELLNTVDAENVVFWRMAFPRWLVNTVACSVNPKLINQNVLVFVGEQGIGKSSWLNKLVPDQLETYLYSGIVNPNNKDTLVNLAENFIINLDELENLNKTELGSLKALITQSAIKLRKAYGIFNESFVRRASFVGSVNEVEFLTDPTGNRRYLVVNCKSIDYTNKVDMDKVYSQAYYHYKQEMAKPGSFKFYFDRSDVAMIEENNNMFNRMSMEEEMLLKNFRNPEDTDDESNVMTLTTTEIMAFISKKENIRGDNSVLRKLGQALQKHGFQKVSHKSSKPYKVVLIDTGEDLHTQYSNYQKNKSRASLNIPEFTHEPLVSESDLARDNDLVQELLKKQKQDSENNADSKDDESKIGTIQNGFSIKAPIWSKDLSDDDGTY